MRTSFAMLAFGMLAITPRPVAAANKIKVQIVESTNIIQMLPIATLGNPEQIDTHCKGNVVGSTANGDCNTTVRPATEPTTKLWPYFRFSAKAILPDGSHALLMCLSPGGKDCAGIAPVSPENSTSECKTAGNTTTCTRRDLGVYEAKRTKNDLIIYGPKGKLRYQIVDSW